MSRSLKKGPYVDVKLLKKVEEMNGTFTQDLNRFN